MVGILNVVAPGRISLGMKRKPVNLKNVHSASSSNVRNNENGFEGRITYAEPVT